MTEVIALRPLTYGDRRMRAGDRFVASPAYARLMCALGNVKLAEHAIELPAAQIPDLEAVIEDPKPKRRQRTYKRRDLRAED